MPSVAIVGPDGAGKTTITKQLVESSTYPFKYMYMGNNIQACNFALPTTRLVERIKRWMNKGQKISSCGEERNLGHRGAARLRNGRLWAAARLLNRLAEEWYRQLLCWFYQWQGFLVLYDRHFVLDFVEEFPGTDRESLSGKIHRWCLDRFYPRPDLVIFLDAPTEILYARKAEWPREELERRRQILIRAGKRLPNFVRIDATQPLDAVYAQVTNTIEVTCERDWGIRKIAQKQALSRSQQASKSSA
jgi:thymidylate kinase